jgi:hypothetical protein
VWQGYGAIRQRAIHVTAASCTTRSVHDYWRIINDLHLLPAHIEVIQVRVIISLSLSRRQGAHAKGKTGVKNWFG